VLAQTFAMNYTEQSALLLNSILKIFSYCINLEFPLVMLEDQQFLEN